MHLLFARPALDRAKTRQYPFDVAIQNRRPDPHTQRGDRASGRPADTGELNQPLNTAREFTGVLADHQLGRLVQIARPTVIAKPGPQMQYLVVTGGSQGMHIRERLHETLVIGNDGGYLRLLQHDLRHPHAVRRHALLPGQVLASVQVIPVQHPLGEVIRAQLENNPLSASRS